MELAQILQDPTVPSSHLRLSILNELTRLYKAACEADQLNTALKALELLGKELDVLIHHQKQRRPISLDMMRNEELHSWLDGNPLEPKITDAPDPQNEQQEKPAMTP